MNRTGKVFSRGIVINWLGKIFFRDYDRAIRRKYARLLGWVLFVALSSCLGVGALLYYLYWRGRV